MSSSASATTPSAFDLIGVGAPVIVIYPLATMALGLLLSSRLRKDRTTIALQASEEWQLYRQQRAAGQAAHG